MQDEKYMNAKTVELIFMKKNERIFLDVQNFWKRSDILKTFSVVYWTETRLFLLKVLMKQSKIINVITARIKR